MYVMYVVHAVGSKLLLLKNHHSVEKRINFSSDFAGFRCHRIVFFLCHERGGRWDMECWANRFGLVVGVVYLYHQ